MMLCLAAAVGLCAESAFAQPVQRDMWMHRLEQEIMAVTSRNDAQVGVAVIVDGRDTLTVGNGVRYPMMSVFKFHQAMAVADMMRRCSIPLGHELHVSRQDLKPDTYSPLRDRFPDGEIDISVGELLRYTLQLSDNNACDILFRNIAGVEETDRYIRSLGINDFAISATEDDMHKDLQLCYSNWSSPLDAAKLLEVFVAGMEEDGYLSFISRLMEECSTGRDRLAKPLSGTGAAIGHKTGTGDCNSEGRIIGINDIGYVFLPDGRRYSIAVFVRDSGESPSDTARIIADISEAVYNAVSGRSF